MGSVNPTAIMLIANLTDVSFIDGGQTLVARLELPDGSETALLIPIA
jgi:dihydropteroate synthase